MRSTLRIPFWVRLTAAALDCIAKIPVEEKHFLLQYLGDGLAEDFSGTVKAIPHPTQIAVIIVRDMGPE